MPAAGHDPDAGKLAAVAARFGLRLVILFGSRAERNSAAGPDSDCDIAVLGCPKGEYWELFKALQDAVPDAPVDLVEIERADPLFRHEIFRNSVLLYGDPDLFCEYFGFAYKDFVDSADLRELEHTLFTKRMARIRERLYGSA